MMPSMSRATSSASSSGSRSLTARGNIIFSNLIFDYLIIAMEGLIHGGLSMEKIV